MPTEQSKKGPKIASWEEGSIIKAWMGGPRDFEIVWAVEHEDGTIEFKAKEVRDGGREAGDNA